MRLIVTTNVQIRACVDGAYFPRCSVLYECKYENLNENMLKQCKSSMSGVGFTEREGGGEWVQKCILPYCSSACIVFIAERMFKVT